MNLFDDEERAAREAVRPLADRMRPRTLAEFVGQGHLLGPDGPLTPLIAADRLTSVVLFGPPGTGKTTLARLLAASTRRRFDTLNAVTSGVKEVRAVIEAAERRLLQGVGTLLFIDEIHRFNKAQQDALLPSVENGTLTLVAATTANPFFSVTGALLSRSRVLELRTLTDEDLRAIVTRALVDRERGLGSRHLSLSEEAFGRLIATSDGDARRALTTLELCGLAIRPGTPDAPAEIAASDIARAVQRKTVVYDADDSHYDVASALIKSLRGSDVDASLYWLARMLEGGEDVRFVCRRLVILASEDIGNADPRALMIAVACQQACEFVGLPECQLTLSQAVCYLALAPKSNAATTAIAAARRDVRDQAVVPVPMHLRDSHSAAARAAGRGRGYLNSHNAEDGVVAQEYLGIDRQYYHPTDRGYEATLGPRLEDLRRRLRGEVSSEEGEAETDDSPTPDRGTD